MAPSKPAVVPMKTMKIILRIGKTKQAAKVTKSPVAANSACGPREKLNQEGKKRITKVKGGEGQKDQFARAKLCMDCNHVFHIRCFRDLCVAGDLHEQCVSCQILESNKELGRAKYPVYNGVWSKIFQQYVYDIQVKRLDEWQGLCESGREEVQPHEVGEIIEILNTHGRLAKADKVSIREVHSVVESSESDTYTKAKPSAKRLAKAKRISGQRTEQNQFQFAKSKHPYPQLKMLALSKALMRAAEEWPEDQGSVSKGDLRETLSNLTEALKVLNRKITPCK